MADSIHVIVEDKKDYDRRKMAEDRESGFFLYLCLVGIYYILALVMLVVGFESAFMYAVGSLYSQFRALVPVSIILPILIMGFVGLGMLLLPAIIRKKKIRISALKDWRFYWKHKVLISLFIIILILVNYYIFKGVK